MAATTRASRATARTRDSRQLDRRELAAWRGMLFTYRDLTTSIDERLEHEHGLSLSSYEVLLMLSAAPRNAMRMGELADGLLLSRSGLTRLVDRMVARDLVERHSCADDRRGTYARLTEAGLKKFREARPTNLAAIRELFLSKLEDDDLERLGSIWERVGEPSPEPEDPAC
ncbi:MAG TPA: MarR family transcriptional regulator [Solirubrobacterales bacterium]|nr:MarR family transcriptional regulator [Solirubrobacterales bacterium]